MAELTERRDNVLQHWLDELSQPLLAASISLEEQQDRLRGLARVNHLTYFAGLVGYNQTRSSG